jgi:hypothetical protein
MHSRGVLMPKLVKTAIAALGALLTVGMDIRYANAQCAAGDKIYIDPRLVPQRQMVSRQQYYDIMTNPYTDPAMKSYIANSFLNQFQPIQIPYGNGMVLVSPNDPCIQQYIGP